MASEQLQIELYRSWMIETEYSDWTTTIIDKLGDICGYRTILESLIDDSERSEVDQLRAEYPEKDNSEFWAYFYPIHWQDIFRPQFRFSWIIWLASYVEYAINTICSDAEFVAQSPMSWEDFKGPRGSVVSRASQFLVQTPLSFSRPTKQEWDWLKNLYILRNVIVHKQGFVSEKDKKERNIAARMSAIREDSEQIELSAEFCDEAAERATQFLLILCDEQSKLCKRLANTL